MADELNPSKQAQVHGKDVTVAPERRYETETDFAVVKIAKIRRVFDLSSLFAFSLAYMGIWEGMHTSMYFALYNGGPQVFVWGFLIVWIGAMAQSATFAEMASIQPIAGAQYHYTWAFSPIETRRFLTWLQGWITWFGFVSLSCGIANINAGMLLALAGVGSSGSYVPQAWHVTLTIYALVLFQASLNIFAFKWIPKIESVAAIMHVALFVVFICVMGAVGEKHSATYVWTYFQASSGWDSQFISWNVGLLSCAYSFTGFDGAIHMSEEVRRARETVPRAMFWSIALNGLLAYSMVIAILFSSGSLEDALSSTWPTFTIMQNVTGSTKATVALISLLMVVSLCSGIACTATVSRLTWAWARDGGLPSLFAQVSRKFGVPVPAVVLSTVLTMLLALLNLGSSAAFGAIIALSSLALYTSYFIAIGCVLYARFTKDSQFELGTWNMGRWGPCVNAFALVYTAWVIVFLPWPSSIPVTASNMNYSGPIFAFCALFIGVTWFAWASTSWEGLSKEVIEYVLTAEQ